MSICHCSNKKSWKGGEFEVTRRSANNAYNWSLEYSTKLRKNRNRISFLNWFVWVMWRLFSVGIRNLCLWWSLKNLNYTKSNKSFFYILLTTITKKKKTYTSTQSLTISFYEFIYLFIFILKSLYDSFIINAANYISFKILIQ